MRIILVRHGKPDISQEELVLGKDFGNWIDQYNAAELDLSLAPSGELITVLKDSGIVVCSTLKRSLDSAKTLEIKNYQSEARFREAELPHFGVFSLRLRAKTWLVVFRILWMLGFSGKVESFANMKLRAKTCAMKLSQLAQEHDSVVFIGHGFLNRSIAKSLMKSAWLELSSPKMGYWSFSVYEYKN